MPPPPLPTSPSSRDYTSIHRTRKACVRGPAPGNPRICAAAETAPSTASPVCAGQCPQRLYASAGDDTRPPPRPPRPEHPPSRGLGLPYCVALPRPPGLTPTPPPPHLQHRLTT